MIILNGNMVYQIVVDGLSPAQDADNTEIDANEYLCYTPLTIFSQVVSQDILEKIVEHEKLHQIWT